MKNFPILALAAIATSALLGGCISVERDDEPERVTTRTTTSSSLLAPSTTTTVQRSTDD